MNNLFKFFVTLCLAIIAAGTAYFAIETYQTNKEFDTYQEEESIPKDLSIDDAVQAFRFEKQYAKDYVEYVNMPEEIIVAIYKNLGTDLTMTQIVEEYHKNKKSYVKDYIRGKLHLQDNELKEKINSIKIDVDIDSMKNIRDSVKIE